MRRLWKIIRQVVAEAIDDGITGEAAKAAYYFFLSLFPAILALFALTGIFGGQQAFDWIMSWLERALPGDAAGYLRQFVAEVTGDSRPGMLSFSILLALWSASNVFAIVEDGLNRMYDLADTRPWWKRRLLAVVAMVAASVLLTSGAVVLLAGPELLDLLGLSLGLATALEALRWPLAALLLTGLLWMVYLLLPDRDQRGPVGPTLVGAIVGMLLWVGATAAFRLYVARFATFSQTYGFVGGIIVLLLWLYLTAFAILLGGELAATLEQIADDDWEVGQPPPK